MKNTENILLEDHILEQLVLSEKCSTYEQIQKIQSHLDTIYRTVLEHDKSINSLLKTRTKTI